MEIFTFLYYANEESDDIIGGSSKTAQHSIENNSRNIKAVFFKLGTSNVHHKSNRMAPTMLLPRQHSWLKSLSVIFCKDRSTGHNLRENDTQDLVPNLTRTNGFKYSFLTELLMNGIVYLITLVKQIVLEPLKGMF